MIKICRVAAACCLAAALVLPGAAAAAAGPQEPADGASAVAGETANAVRLTVTATILNVRGEPSLTAAIIGKLKQGAVVEKLEANGEWVKIRLGSLVGWAHSDYLAPAEAEGGPGEPPAEGAAGPDGGGVSGAEQPRPRVIGRGIRIAPERQEVEAEAAEIAAERPGYVTGDAVRVRSGPGREYAITGHLNRGDRVTVTGSEGEWYSVVTQDGQAGWIAAAYIGFRADGEPAGDVLRGKIIVVDPGHGGNDSGTIGTTFGTWEKTINLSTAIHLKRELEMRGAIVVMTRVTDDERPSLRDRVAIAEQSGGDAFVSIHYNSAASQASGILTFYYSGGKDRPLAAAIERRLAEAESGLASNGVSFGNFHVMRENSLPAVLLELGFLTNARDEELARTESYQMAMARAIALGLEDYFAALEARS